MGFAEFTDGARGVASDLKSNRCGARKKNEQKTKKE
jgi:hypothetical protein